MLSKTKQWMIDHPDDLPCPEDPRAAMEWRQERGLCRKSWGAYNEERRARDLERYNQAMAEKHAREVGS